MLPIKIVLKFFGILVLLFILVGFVIPMLMSTRDTFAVALGVILVFAIVLAGLLFGNHVLKEVIDHLKDNAEQVSKPEDKKNKAKK